MPAALPHENAYWVEPGRLMAGEYPGHADRDIARQRLRAYLACGVDLFIDLTTVSDPLAPYAELLQEEAQRLGRIVAYQRFPIPDLGVPESPAVMSRILDAIDGAVGAGQCVYVHCWGGVGRTGTVVGCFLVRHGATGEAALSRLNALWSTVAKRHRKPMCPETRTQLRFVRDWQESAWQATVPSLGAGMAVQIGLFVGDLLRAPGEAVCTSTNPHLALMAGTGGAVRLFGGQQIQEECDRHVAEAFAASGKHFLKPGMARLTGAGSLPYKAIIHCVAIDAFHGSSIETIDACVRNALALAAEAGIAELAMPVFATGNGRFPYDQSLQAMVEALRTSDLGSVKKVWIVVTRPEASEARSNLESMLATIEIRAEGEA